MKVYSKIVLDMTKDDLPVLLSESFDYDGEVQECKGGSSGSYKISNEEKALYKQLTENMSYFQNLYKTYQQDYDTQIIQQNKQLLPQVFEYNKAQLEDARADLSLNRGIKDSMAQKQAKDIEQQSQLADLQFADSKERLDRYSQVEGQLASERLGMLSADVNGVMGRATSDVAQAYGTQRDALAREQARVGVSPTSGAANESSRLTALDFAKTNALGRETARNNELTRVENANVQRAAANWSKDTSLLNGGRSTMTTAKDYSAMLNGGYGVYNPYSVNTPSNTDFAAATNQAAGSAQGAPSGTYVQGKSSNMSGIGGALGMGAGFLMGGPTGAMLGGAIGSGVGSIF